MKKRDVVLLITCLLLVAHVAEARWHYRRGRDRSWRGGWKNGYKTLRDGTFVHRYVAERTYGPIPRGYEVHHINGDKEDNRPCNLAVLSKEEHRKIHSAAKNYP